MRSLIVPHKKNETAKNTKGFTLVELLVVISILGILAAILVPSLLGYIDRHKEQQVITECRSVVLTAQSMYAKSYELGQPAPSKSDIINESGLTDGSITHIELNSSSIKDSTDILLHLTYVDQGITVTYCRDYRTAHDGHDDLYTLNDGPDGDGSWGTKPVPSTEVDSETETETEADNGLYMPVGDLKFEITDTWSNFLDTLPEDNSQSFNIPSNQSFLLSNGNYVYVVWGDITINKDNKVFPEGSSNTATVDTSQINSGKNFFVPGSYSNWLAGYQLKKGMIVQDDISTGKYYLYISANTYNPNDNVNWLYDFSNTSAWRELTLH